jgi:two-component system nitrate/nitrite sensor histidine kinase NarX
LTAPILLTKTQPGEQVGTPSFSPAFLSGIWQTIGSSRNPLAIENVTFDDGRTRLGLLAVPLSWRDEPPVGLLLLISPQLLNLTDHQRLIVQALAGEAALIVQNSRLMVRLQYRAVLDERTRLAREIHDGLAQTLAFLKIQTAQMQHYLEQGKMERLEQALESNHQTLSEAYRDARLAIDNLRSVPETSTADWLVRISRDLQEASGMPVTVKRLEIERELPPTAQVQLIRIVQEVFNNIRKHSHAHAVVLEVWEEDVDFMLEILDDGIGFDPSRLELESHYGILGMQERAELLGAKLQLESHPDQGTRVRLEIPNGVREL